MIDLAMKQEVEKQGKIANERLRNISKQFSVFADKMIKEYNLLSSEYLTILNNLAAIELNTRINDVVNTNARKNLNLRQKIIKN